MTQQIRDVENVIEGLGDLGYVADRALATAVYLLLKLEKPLLIEGHAGVGKTEAAKALADMLETELIRLQCYEGLDLNSAVYEWNYQKQLLAIKIQEGSDKTIEEKESYVFGSGFLLKRPLLQSILYEEKAPVLLVDEIDRADEGEDRRGARRPARIVDRAPQRDEAEIEDEEHQDRGETRVPDPVGPPHRLAPERAGREADEGEARPERRRGLLRRVG